MLAGTSTVALGPADANLKNGTNTIGYAWGSASANNLKLAVQTVSGGRTPRESRLRVRPAHGRASRRRRPDHRWCVMFPPQECCGR